MNFLNEKTETSEENVKCCDLYQEFLTWFKKNNPSVKPENIKDFNLGIKKHKKIEKIRFNKSILLGIKKLKIIDEGEDENTKILNNYINTYKKYSKIPLKTFILSCIKNNPILTYNYIELYIKRNYKIYNEHNIIFIKDLNNDNDMSKGELFIQEYLANNKISFEYQKYFEDCIDKTYLPFDFYIPEINTCIEYDGEQHYMPINSFGGIDSFNIIKKHDIIKNSYCKKKNIVLLRIKYDDSEEVITNKLINLFNVNN